jgi:SAM-dependent methyltransferase
MKYDKEAAYWGDCYSEVAFGEVCKQRMYGREMGLFRDYGDEYGDLNLQGKSIIDIGGGPWSMLLRCYNATNKLVIDPIDWPPSVYRRYQAYGITVYQQGGEEPLDIEDFYQIADEVWIYNCLQHVNDPLKVLANAKKLGRRIRLFEWLWTGSDECHPHILTPELLMEGLVGTTTEEVTNKRYTEFGCCCNALAGVFRCES